MWYSHREWTKQSSHNSALNMLNQGFKGNTKQTQVSVDRHPYAPTTWETLPGRSWVPDKHGLHTDSVCYTALLQLSFEVGGVALNFIKRKINTGFNILHFSKHMERAIFCLYAIFHYLVYMYIKSLNLLKVVKIPLKSDKETTHH